ncbi:uncharacterized protein LOC142584936 isoform X2 [Dermacentor variabilis]|uniref:uncharacterized protein LOC142584936 isoform X2 n=1 Tax=Dermacentor variabilis TaxID=34621 RepID=UPI003F5B585E
MILQLNGQLEERESTEVPSKTAKKQNLSAELSHDPYFPTAPDMTVSQWNGEKNLRLTLIHYDPKGKCGVFTYLDNFVCMGPLLCDGYSFKTDASLQKLLELLNTTESIYVYTISYGQCKYYNKLYLNSSHYDFELTEVDYTLKKQNLSAELSDDPRFPTAPDMTVSQWNGEENVTLTLIHYGPREKCGIFTYLDSSSTRHFELHIRKSQLTDKEDGRFEFHKCLRKLNEARGQSNGGE